MNATRNEVGDAYASIMTQAAGSWDKDKQPTPTLRVFSGEHDAQWLLYGSIAMGRQGGKEAVEWFELGYRGIILWQGVDVFGDWKIRVDGKNLEYTCAGLSKHLLRTLKREVAEEKKYTISSIVITPWKIMMMRNMPDIFSSLDEEA